MWYETLLLRWYQLRPGVGSNFHTFPWSSCFCLSPLFLFFLGMKTWWLGSNSHLGSWGSLAVGCHSYQGATHLLLPTASHIQPPADLMGMVMPSSDREGTSTYCCSCVRIRKDVSIGWVSITLSLFGTFKDSSDAWKWIQRTHVDESQLFRHKHTWSFSLSMGRGCDFSFLYPKSAPPLSSPAFLGFTLSPGTHREASAWTLLPSLPGRGMSPCLSGGVGGVGDGGRLSQLD
jgi:hypothetical protein